MAEPTPVYVTKAFLPPYEEYIEGLKEIWDSAILTNQGSIHNRLGEQLNEYLKVKNIVLFVNGHQALELGLKALKIEGEVITTPFTFASTTHAITRSGLLPVFCDIRGDNFNIDETKIQRLITPRTRAIMPVHVYGTPCNIEEINRIANEYGLKVFYDAAHAFGVEVNGVGIGSFGDMAMFSFHATKVYNTVEGGALTFADPAFERELYLLKNFGIAGPEEVLSVGSNAKMNEFQALMGVINLRYIDREIALRKRAVQTYRQLLSTIPGICLMADTPGVRHNYAYFPILVDETQYGLNRDELFALLEKNEIHPRKYFYPLVTDYACYQGSFDCEQPVASYVAKRILTLPLWGEIPLEIIARICSIIEEGHRIV